MTVEIKGDNIKITLTKEELKGIRPSLPYQLTTVIGEAESSHDGYAHSTKLQTPEVHTSKGGTLTFKRYNKLPLPTKTIV